MDQQKKIGYAYVFVQLALVLLIVVLPHRTDWPGGTLVTVASWAIFLTGMAIMGIGALGLGSGLTAHPVPNGRTELKTTGLYAFVRHPIYLGVLTTMLGVTIRTRSFIALGAYIALSVLLHFKANWEEQRLREHFSDYDEYASKVGRLIPGIDKAKPADPYS